MGPPLSHKVSRHAWAGQVCPDVADGPFEHRYPQVLPGSLGVHVTSGLQRTLTMMIWEGSVGVNSGYLLSLASSDQVLRTTIPLSDQSHFVTSHRRQEHYFTNVKRIALSMSFSRSFSPFLCWQSALRPSHFGTWGLSS